jgi:hypothetical protein
MKPPGTYTVTFTLPGFSTVRREEVNVGGVGVITINAEMRVGGLHDCQPAEDATWTDGRECQFG